MTSRSERTPRGKQTIYARDLDDGVRLEAEVSPCVFMYPSYPFQMEVHLLRHPGENLGKTYALDRTQTADTYTDATARFLLAGIRTAPCTRCATPAFDPATIHTNRGGLCEACFLADLEAEHAAGESAEQGRITARDHRMKRNGMVFRVSGWVHPQGGGDDYQLDWYLSASPRPNRSGVSFASMGPVVSMTTKSSPSDPDHVAEEDFWSNRFHCCAMAAGFFAAIEGRLADSAYVRQLAYRWYEEGAFRERMTLNPTAQSRESD